MSSFTSELWVTPLRGMRNWKLLRRFTYHIGSKHSRHYISVPKGFITDFASVPKLTSPLFTLIGLGLYLLGFDTLGVIILLIICALSWFREWGKHGKAAVIHDRLYQTHEVTRRMADLIFYEAMLIGGTKKWKAKLMYFGVRIFGFLAWRKK